MGDDRSSVRWFVDFETFLQLGDGYVRGSASVGSGGLMQFRWELGRQKNAVGHGMCDAALMFGVLLGPIRIAVTMFKHVQSPFSAGGEGGSMEQRIGCASDLVGVRLVNLGASL